MSEDAAMSVVEDVERFEIMRARYQRHAFPPHMHDTFAIGVHEAGQSRLLYRAEVKTLRPHGVIVIEPGEVHTGVPDDNEGWRYRMLYVPVSILREAAGWPVGATPRFNRCFYEDPLLASRVLEVHRHLECGSDAAAARLSMRRVLSDLVHAHAVRTPNLEHHNIPPAIERVRAYLHTHFAKSVSVATMAEIAGLSPWHLIRTFRAHVGMPPYMYLEQLRINRARNLLRTGMPISHVAYDTGFADQSHLTRRFRSVVGMPPGRYARSHAG